MLKEDAWKFHETLEVPFVTHFRKQSIGAICQELTHPFIVSKESPLDLQGEVENNLLFMNGTACVWWPEMLNASGRYIEDGEKMSDARAMACIIANDNEQFLKKITAKFVVVDPKDSKFYFYGDFQEENGILLSNKEWQNFNCSKKKKTQKISTQIKQEVSMNCGTNTLPNTSNVPRASIDYSLFPKDYDKPWNGSQDSKHRVLRFLLNRITLSAAKNLWAYYQKRNNLNNTLEKAIKILKQQSAKFPPETAFTPEKEKRIRLFIEADKLEWPSSHNFLMDNGIRTLNLWEEPFKVIDNAAPPLKLLTYNPHKDQEGQFLGIGDNPS